MHELRLFTARKLNGVPLQTLSSKDELKANGCHYHADYNGKPFPHWVTTPNTNVANKFVLQHLSQGDYEQVKRKIEEHGHPANLAMLAEFDRWATTHTTLIHHGK